MLQLHERLLQLSRQIPAYDAIQKFAVVSGILHQYQAILDIVSQKSAAYKRDTAPYYIELASLHSEANKFARTNSTVKRARCFANLVRWLSSDVQALNSLIAYHEKLELHDHNQ